MQPGRQEMCTQSTHTLRGCLELGNESGRAASAIKQTVLLSWTSHRDPNCTLNLGHCRRHVVVHSSGQPCRLVVLWAVSVSDRLHVGDG